MIYDNFTYWDLEAFSVTEMRSFIAKTVKLVFNSLTCFFLNIKPYTDTHESDGFETLL